MNDLDHASDSAFAFHGSWREFAPIALTNLLLTIATLGIYRFWAVTRERQYLWNRTQFIDERLEWTGTGKELFIGALLVLFLLGLPLILLNLGIQALYAAGEVAAGFALTAVLLLAIFYLTGVARFRMLRYRLGRTYWRGIRGGSEDRGFRYGLSYCWKMAVGLAAFGLMVPWAMVSLWNERWRRLGFGPHPFRSDAEFSPLMWRYLTLYLAPVVALLTVALFGFLFAMSGAFDNMDEGSATRAGIGFALFALLAFYAIVPLIGLFYYSAFLRLMIGELELTGLDFAFTARTKDWFKLIVGDVLLVVATLGVGVAFLGYRHWKFFVTHMEANGEIDPGALTQSTTIRTRHGEGLFDALDSGVAG